MERDNLGASHRMTAAIQSEDGEDITKRGMAEAIRAS